LNIEIEKCENKRKLIAYNLNKGDQLEKVLGSTFQDLESILSMNNMTNAQLKRIIDKIVVDEHGKIDVYLKLLSDIGLDQSVLVSTDRT
ncbi:MAG: recombinase family protein, partial [Acetivibrio sp.]